MATQPTPPTDTVYKLSSAHLAPEWGWLLGSITATNVRSLVHDGTIPSAKVGRERLVRGSAIAAYVAQVEL